MPRLILSLGLLAFFLANACQNSPSSPQAPALNAAGKQEFAAIYGTPVLDCSGADDVWDQAEWLPIDQVWLGKTPTPDDFAGRYKVAWDENNLYILAEITDDSLLDIHPEGLEQYWNDDGLDIFLDEDASGGPHEYSYNAFAYHVALDGRVTDIAPDSSYRFFDDHCLSRRLTRDHVTTWEIAIRVFGSEPMPEDGQRVPKLLKAGKVLGFALAYSDNDRSPERENVIGSVIIPGPDKMQAWKNASVLGELHLH